MIAELLRHPFGTAAVAESTDRRGDRQPHLTRAGLIAALQPRCEDGVSSEGANARAGHHRAHGGPPRVLIRPGRCRTGRENSLATALLGTPGLGRIGPV